VDIEKDGRQEIHLVLQILSQPGHSRFSISASAAIDVCVKNTDNICYSHSFTSGNAMCLLCAKIHVICAKNTRSMVV